MTRTATKPAERPLVLKADQVRAILDGTMTEIRLPVRPSPYRSGKHPDEWMRLTGPGMVWTSNRERREVWKKHPRECVSASEYHVPLEGWLVGQCPLGRTGDTLYVREGFKIGWTFEHGHGLFYRADLPRPDGHPRGDRRPFHCANGCCNGPLRVGYNWLCEHYGCDFRTERWRSSTSMPRWAARIILTLADVRVERTDAGADATVRDARPAFDWVVRFRKIDQSEGSHSR